MGRAPKYLVVVPCDESMRVATPFFVVRAPSCLTEGGAQPCVQALDADGSLVRGVEFAEWA